MVFFLVKFIESLKWTKNVGDILIHILINGKLSFNIGFFLSFFLHSYMLIPPCSSLHKVTFPRMQFRNFSYSPYDRDIHPRFNRDQN